MFLIISKVLVVFIYIGIGFAANKLKLLPGESIPYFTSLLMEITVPCMVISSIVGQEIEGRMYMNTLLTFVLTSLGYVAVAVATTFVSDRVFRSREQQDRNVLASSMTGCNSGFMGFPIVKAVFGTTALYYMVIQSIANNLYLFVMSYAQLHHRESSRSAAKNWKAMLRPLVNTTNTVTVISIILLFTGVGLPSYALDIFTTVGDVTIPLSMILVGIQLGGSDFRNIFGEKDLIISSAIKLAAAPALIMLLMMPLPVDNIVKLTAVMGTAFPSSVIGVAVSAREHKNSQLMAEAVANSTMLSLITLPIWIMICTELYL